MQMMRTTAGSQWKNFLLRGLLILVLAVAAGGPTRAADKIEKQADGNYLIIGSDYRARIYRGVLDSLQVNGAEFFNGPLLTGSADWRSLQPIGWHTLKVEQPQANELKFTLGLPSAPLEAALALTYRAAPDGLRVIMERLTDAWGGSIAWHTGERVIALEPLARPGFGYTRLPGNGLVYALPLSTPRLCRDMRYYFDNGSAVDVAYLLNDGPYNISVSGAATGDLWGRSVIDRRPFELIFAPVRTLSGAAATAPNAAPPLRRLPAVTKTVKLERGLPFSVTADAPESMSPLGKPAGFRLHLTSESRLSRPQTLTYRLLDFQDKEALRGTETVTPKNLKDDLYRFDVLPKNTGWYRLVASLRPADKPDALPSEDQAECGVYTPTVGVTDPPTKNSGVGITGGLGLRCIRQALYLNQFFPTREKSPVGNPKFNWKPMDEQIYPFFAECAEYGMNGFCLLNLRPGWADPPAFEALIRAIAGRYKAANHRWEIENEPQDRYTPENYVAQALAPAFRGAHAADPAAQIMGPAIVRVDLRWFALFFNAKGGESLDIVSTHSYIGTNRSWEEHGNAEDFVALQNLMAAHGLAKKPIWQTEQGFTWNNHADMPRLHAAYAARMFALAASVGVPNEHCYYFYTIYNGFEPWYLFDGAPNRSGMALRIFAEQTAGMKFQREIPMGKFAHALVFTDGKQDALVCWLDDFRADVTFRMPPDARPKIVDIMGVPVVPQSEKAGLITLRLDGFPRYFRAPHGTSITPLERFPAGTNLADAKTGAVASASSFAGAETDAANLNEGTWHFDDGQTDQKIWVGKPDAPMPQWAAVRFPEPRRIDTIAAITPSSNVGLPGARHYRLQVETNGIWRTVREVRDNTTEWVLYAHFPPVTAAAVRVVFLDLNNGWWRDDKAKFSDMSARVYELEAYGPQSAAR